MSEIVVRIAESKKDKKAFIDFAYRLYKNEKNWVPPFRMEVSEFLNPKKHPFYEHGTITPYIAIRDNKVVGRIAAIINGNHNAHHKDKTGFFGFFEAVEDIDVFKALIEPVKEELSGKGMDQIMGPVNPSLNDTCLFLTKGFHLPPFVMMSYNFPYYAELFYEMGFNKAKGFYAYYGSAKVSTVNEKMLQVERILKKRNYKIREIKMKDWKKEANTIADIFADAWSKNWGFVPMSEHEFAHTAMNLKMIAVPKFIYMVEKEGKPVAFSLGLPDINEVLVHNRNGRLRPDIIFKLLRRKTNPRNVRIMLLGVRQEYQKFGIGGVLYAKYMRMALETGLEGGEMSWVLDDNVEMNRAQN